VAAKPDSQEICFIPDHDYAGFISRHSASPRGGEIVDETGRVLAQHGGIHRFTVGQRKGLGLSASPTGAPMYVLALRPQDREVVVGPRASLERTRLTASGVNWIEGVPQGSRRGNVQIRHRHPAAPATIHAVDDSRAEVIFDQPQLAITPGQAAVFYDGEVVVGGGWIDN
jgi:tRNA-specific 2-thiouridylase